MTQYNTLNVKLSNSQLKKLKSGLKNGTEVTLKLTWNVIGGSNNENNFRRIFLLTNTQILKLRKVFANGSAVNMKLSKTQLYIIRQPGRFLGRLLGSLLKTELPLMKNLLKPLAKSVLILLELTAAAGTDATIHKKILGSGTTTLIISNEEINDIMKIIKSLEESGFLKLVKERWEQARIFNADSSFN